ncbi:MAG: peptidase MA family metallohydrolase [Clostridiaceae bacterium]|nr:peptidase MA family metallohydrolase [Clostridiaceae bacterium]
MKKRISKLAIVLALVSVLFFFTSDKGLIAAKMQGYEALKVFAQVKSSELTPEFNIYETENFIIKYTDKDEDIIRDIAGIFEKSYKIEGMHYNYCPEDKTIVFVYADQESMWDYQQSVKGQAVMGLYNLGIIHILSPKVYLSDRQMYIKDYETNGPILHEYVHRVIDDRSGGNIELWLTEGLALYEEYAVDGTEWAEGFSYERYYSAQELRNNFMELDETQAYKQSYDIVRGLIEQKGRKSIIDMLDKLKKGSTLDEAFLKTYGGELNEYIDSGAWKAEAKK